MRPSWQQVAAESPATKHLWQQWSLLRLQDGVLQRRWEDARGRASYWVVLVPRTLRQELLQEVHGGITSGHLGEKKTLSRLRQRYYWVGMRRDVQEWCRACDVCCAKKGPTRKTRAPLQLYQVGAPMERVAVDIAGPLPVTTQGNRFICVVIDYFTRWPEAYALPDHEAATVAGVLVDQFFTRFGVPGELHSDQGREFESAVFQECCRLLGIKKTRTTPLRPQSDGMVERFHRTLLHEMAKYCSTDQRDWDTKLPTLLMAYRSAEHEATNYTPARLMLGRELRLPVDLATGHPPHDTSQHETTDYARKLREALVEAHQYARGHSRAAGRAMKTRYDARARGATFNPGDKVWLYNPRRKKGLSPKLQSPWEGPYDVSEVLSDVTYRIRRGSRSRPRVVHVDRLWAYHGAGEYSWGADGSQEKAEDGASIEGSENEDLDELSALWEDEVASVTTPTQEEAAVATSAMDRPRRGRRPPIWTGDYMMDEH